MLVDEKSWDLAVSFLAEYKLDADARENLTQLLAEKIQKVVEEFCEPLEEKGEGSMRIAERISKQLFMSGTGSEAKRLVLELEDGMNGGGWDRKPVEDVIQKEVEEMENSFHLLCTAILGGSSDEVIKKYAEDGLKVLGVQ